MLFCSFGCLYETFLIVPFGKVGIVLLLVCRQIAAEQRCWVIFHLQHTDGESQILAHLAHVQPAVAGEPGVKPTNKLLLVGFGFLQLIVTVNHKRLQTQLRVAADVF